MKPTIELLRDVLDHDIVDADGVRCGMVDDIEFEHAPRRAPKLAAILVGAGAWGPRLPALFAVLAWKLSGRRVTRIPWDEVAELGQSVKLKRRASEFGLGKAERKASKWLQRIPGS